LRDGRASHKSRQGNRGNDSLHVSSCHVIGRKTLTLERRI
jgi:hypothetical protein